MGTDSFTNFLLITLIGLIAWLGRAAYDKINEIMLMIRSIFELNAKRGEEIETLKRNQIDHEDRIRELEREVDRLSK